ncbi:hypothetical protein CP532_3012 [Ophiocordyceps camponoti-leonardi (nom. inval.)]|nr:hypothetical protein CP532_3012 [Ophiocordyceps camponoti-leonardi (nom. inval.)]
MLGRYLLLPLIVGAFVHGYWVPEIPPLSQVEISAFSKFWLRRGVFDLRNFEFIDGNTTDVRLHYWTLGHIKQNYKNKTINAVLLLHGTAESGQDFMSLNFAEELFEKWKPLDARNHYIIIPDAIGHGRSSKPSDGLGTGFPRYRHEDTVNAVRQLLAKLKVDRLRLILGASGGGSQAWNYASVYPDEVAAIMTLAWTPIPVSGRERMMRQTIVEAIRSDATFNNGFYEQQPKAGLTAAVSVASMMTLSPVWLQERGPDELLADGLRRNLIDGDLRKVDANDMMYQWGSTWKHDIVNSYRKMKCHVNAINTEDDVMNPYIARLLDRTMVKVPRASWFTIPIDRGTFGHRTYRNATIWKDHLWDVMNRGFDDWWYHR